MWSDKVNHIQVSPSCGQSLTSESSTAFSWLSCLLSNLRWLKDRILYNADMYGRNGVQAKRWQEQLGLGWSPSEECLLWCWVGRLEESSRPKMMALSSSRKFITLPNMAIEISTWAVTDNPMTRCWHWALYKRGPSSVFFQDVCTPFKVILEAECRR